MSATTTRAPTREVDPGGTGGAGFAGTATLVRFLLRRDRVRLPAWAGGLGLFVVYLTVALPAVAATEEDLAATTQLFQDPVGRLLVGPGYGLDAPTYERLVANGYGLYLLILTALMSILLVVRHTRAEEQSGRAELVRANVVGRRAVLTAVMVVAVVTNLVVSAVIALTMVGVGGYALEGSLLLAAALAAVGLAFAGIAAVTVQLSEYPRAATGSASAVLGLAFLLRAVGDLAQEGRNALSWASPLAWGQQTAPFVLDRWWPLLLPVALALATTGVAHAVSTRRDLGASLVAVRPGAAEAPRWLGTPVGLAFRLQRGAMLGWGVGLAVTGLTLGAYADAMLTAMGDLPEAFVELFGAEDLLAGYLAYMAAFMGYLAAAYAVAAVQGWRSEETAGRAEPVLATPVGRVRWLAANLGVVAAGVVAVLLTAGVATGVGAAIVTGDAGHLGDLTVAHLNQVPAVLVVVALAVLLFGLAPRFVGLAWVLVGYALVVGTFGEMLDLPDAASALSPFEHTAEVPLEPVAFAPLAALVGLALAATAVGAVAYRRRGIGTA
jgi:ABC-2 type transport system permease protein